MAWVYIEELGRHVGEEITLKGWLYHRRSSGKIHFLVVRDGTIRIDVLHGLAPHHPLNELLHVRNSRAAAYKNNAINVFRF